MLDPVAVELDIFIAAGNPDAVIGIHDVQLMDEGSAVEDSDARPQRVGDLTVGKRHTRIRSHRDTEIDMMYRKSLYDDGAGRARRAESEAPVAVCDRDVGERETAVSGRGLEPNARAMHLEPVDHAIRPLEHQAIGR